MNAKQLEELLHREIPISRQMGVRDLDVKNESVSLLLPITPNRNHKSTLFGGSLYSASALACYGLFLAGLAERGLPGNNIVIAEGNIKYLKPVTGDIRIRAVWNTSEEKERFFQTLLNKKKARVVMNARSEEGGQICTEFASSFATWI